MAVEIGQKFPEFQLPDEDRKPRALKEFLGKKTVLTFLPGAFTGVCTKEMCTLRDSAQDLSQLNAQVVGITVSDPWSNKGFKLANNLQFTILSDYTRNVVKSLNMFHDDFGGLKGYTASKRAVFVLDPAGTVRYKWVSEDPGKEPNYDEIKDALKNI